MPKGETRPDWAESATRYPGLVQPSRGVGISPTCTRDGDRRERWEPIRPCFLLCPCTRSAGGLSESRARGASEVEFRPAGCRGKEDGRFTVSLRFPARPRLRSMNFQLAGPHSNEAGSFNSAAGRAKRKKATRRWPFVFGTPGRNRTCNPRLRRPVLYPIELRAQSRLCSAADNPGCLPAGEQTFAGCAGNMGWLMGLEPTTTGVTVRGSTN